MLNLRLTSLSPNEMRVQWSPPLQQHGTIVGYDISYRLKHRLACPEEDPRDVSRDYVTIYNHKDTDYTLTGLLPNTMYEVKGNFLYFSYLILIFSSRSNNRARPRRNQRSRYRTAATKCSTAQSSTHLCFGALSELPMGTRRMLSATWRDHKVILFKF